VNPTTSPAIAPGFFITIFRKEDGKMLNAYRMLYDTPGLFKHSCWVMITTKQIINYLPQGLVSVSQIQDILLAALYHDLGKATWPADWHTKPFQEIKQNWESMKLHPIKSVSLLKTAPAQAQQYILQHHERPGGKGYPYGIEPDFHSLILASADVFVACIESREYRKSSLSLEDAILQVSKFAPDVILVALKAMVQGNDQVKILA
jgi:HD-GYP domain-containing protein (c-di-GMP phosphodiesterase class II)